MRKKSAPGLYHFPAPRLLAAVTFLAPNMIGLRYGGRSARSAFLSSSIIFMFCGQWASHLPQATHWDAKPGSALRHMP